MLSSAFALPSPSASSRWIADCSIGSAGSPPSRGPRYTAAPPARGSPTEERDRRQQSRHQQAARKPASMVRCQAKPVRSFCSPGSQGARVIQSSMISATIPTLATMAVSTRSRGEDGSGSPSRIALSLPIHLLNAPIPQAKPQMTRTAAASRTSRPSRSVRCATAAIATPAARKPRPVRIQARKVRSLAKVNRGSGSEPAAHAARPATVAVLRRRGHTGDVSADRRRRQSSAPGWPSTTETRTRTARGLPEVEALVEYHPAQQGCDHWVEQSKKGHRARGQPLQPQNQGVRDNPADQNEIDQPADVTRREVVGESFDEQCGRQGEPSSRKVQPVTPIEVIPSGRPQRWSVRSPR